MKGDVSVAADVRATAEAIASEQRAENGLMAKEWQSRSELTWLRSVNAISVLVRWWQARSRGYTMGRSRRCPMRRARYQMEIVSSIGCVTKDR